MQKKILSLFILTGVLSSQESFESHVCPCGPRASKIEIKHLEYQGIGFDEGYTSLDLFLALPTPNLGESLNFFFDGRAHVFNNGRPAVNAGLGCRYVFDSLVDAVGINTYYDYRNSKRKNYNQVGVGLEYLKTNWEFRANGYFPVGKQVSDLFDLEFSHFTGHSVYVSRKHEFAMTGADGEIGWHFKQWDNFDLFLGVGPYYFKGNLGEAAIGGKARIQARWSEYLSLQVADSYDAVFDNRFNAEFAISIPFGPRSRPKSESRSCCINENRFQQWVHTPPSRNEMIVLKTKKKTSVAVDPGNGQPYFFWFVNNTSSSSGTFESPYPTFAQVESTSLAGDIIYVFPGDQTTTGMDQGIVLKDNQQFLGSGVSHQLATTLGTLTILPQSSTSPIITNQNMAAVDVVTIANSNTISGFTIECANSNGVTVNGIGQSNPSLSLSNLTATYNLILKGNTGSSTHGIELQNASGNIFIAYNTFSAAGSGSETGINIVNSNVNSANIQIKNNLIVAPNPISIALTDCTKIHSMLSNNEILGLNVGVLFNVANIDLADANSIAIQNNTINSSGDTIDLLIAPAMADFANVDIAVKNNTLTSGSTCLYQGFGGSSQTTTEVSGNSMISTGNIPLIYDLSVNAITTATMNKNTLKVATTANCSIHTSNTSMFTGTLYKNTFLGEIGPDLFITSDSPLPMNISILQNEFNGGFNGIQLDANNDTTVIASIINNHISNQSNAGINVQTTGTSITKLDIERNHFNGSLTSAASILNGGDSVCLSFRDNISSEIQIYPVSGGSLQGAYQLTNAGTTFSLEPLSGNVGVIDFSGTITDVPEGNCD